MEAAAAVIAVITFSLQSTKFVYQTIEEIRDGPSVVNELAERARRLDGVLQQLLQLAEHSERSARVHDPSIWKPLETKASQCSSDLQETTSKLKALDLDKTKHHLEKAWKRIKVSLKEKDLARISGQLQYHLAELGTQLLIVNRYAFCILVSPTCPLQNIGVIRDAYEVFVIQFGRYLVAWQQVVQFSIHNFFQTYVRPFWKESKR